MLRWLRLPLLASGQRQAAVRESRSEGLRQGDLTRQQPPTATGERSGRAGTGRQITSVRPDGAFDVLQRKQAPARFEIDGDDVDPTPLRYAIVRLAVSFGEANQTLPLGRC